MLVRSQGLGWLAVFPRPARVATTDIQSFNLLICLILHSSKDIPIALKQLQKT
jgi:hypothetical protein